MKKSMLAALSIALGISSALTGCGTGKTTTPTPTTAKPTDKQITFKLVNWGSPAQQELLKQVTDAYTKKNPNLKVDLVQTPYGEFTEKVTTLIASGNPPDITWWAEDSFQFFADKGYFMELDSAIAQWGAEWDKDDFYPNALNEGKYKDKQYGIPFSVPAHVLFYNKKLFDEAKIKYPDESWTWEDLAKAAKSLTKGEGADKVYGITNLLDKGTEWQNLINIMRAYGGSIVNEDATKCTMNSPEAKSAINLYMDLLKGGYTTKPGANAPFEQGKAAMFLGYLSFNGSFVTAPNLDYDIAYLPKGPKGRFGRSGMALYTIMKTTKHPSETLDLMKFVTGKEQSKLQSKLWGPSRKSVGLSPDFMADVPKPANKQIFIKSLEFCKPTEHFPAFMNANTVIKEELDKVFFDKQTLDAGLANIEKRVNELVSPKK